MADPRRSALRAFFALALAGLLAGCDIVEVEGPGFPEPRYYAAESTHPEFSYLALFCPDRRVDYVLGGDVVERSTYRRRERRIEVGTPVVARYTLSADEAILRLNGSGVELTRRRELEPRLGCGRG